MSFSCASAWSLYFAAASRSAGPSFFLSTPWHLKQPLFCASDCAAGASAASVSTRIEPQASTTKLSIRAAASTRCEPRPSVWLRVEHCREDMARKLLTSPVDLQGIESAFLWGDTVGLYRGTPVEQTRRGRAASASSGALDFARR